MWDEAAALDLRRKAEDYLREYKPGGYEPSERESCCLCHPSATEGGSDCDRPLGWAQTVTEGRVHSPPAGCFIRLVVLFQNSSFLAYFYKELKVFQVVKIAAFVLLLEVPSSTKFS